MGITSEAYFSVALSTRVSTPTCSKKGKRYGRTFCKEGWSWRFQPLCWGGKQKFRYEGPPRLDRFHNAKLILLWPLKYSNVHPDAGGSRSHETRDEHADISNGSGGTRAGEGQSNQQWGNGMSTDQAPQCALAMWWAWVYIESAENSTTWVEDVYVLFSLPFNGRFRLDLLLALDGWAANHSWLFYSACGWQGE